ncbi:MAG: cytochrome b/b6 domain-containing protein [Ignavibacteriaceae bacterium]|nr:cytochrome b/b6 domain-containing protein [Ignavibacteriaceae bacterium]
MDIDKKILIWDLPVRFFHWLLVLGFFSAAIIALGFGDDNQNFAFHAIIGLILFFMVILRIFYGFFGTNYARFKSFLFHPKEFLIYFKSALLLNDKSYLGHNPGSAYAILFMLALIIGISITGIQLGLGNENLKDLHEIFVYLMLATVSLHIIGVIFHIFRHRDNIIASMIHGKKRSNSEVGITSSRVVVLIIFLSLLSLFTFDLISSHQKNKKTINIPVIGVQLQIGEFEIEQGKFYKNNNEHEKDDD